MPNIIIHVTSNVVLILLILIYNRKKKQKSDLKFVALTVFASNLIDLDHLLANPIYDPLRCSINFHPLHTWYMFPMYFLGIIYRRTRYLCMGIAVHLLLDGLDCFL